MNNKILIIAMLYFIITLLGFVALAYLHIKGGLLLLYAIFSIMLGGVINDLLKIK